MTDAFLSYLLTLTIRSQRITSPLPTWRARFESLVHSTFLHFWRLYKFAFRLITGQGALERLCQRALEAHVLRIYEKEIQFDTRDVRNVIWRIGLGVETFLLICRCRVSAFGGIG